MILSRGIFRFLAGGGNADMKLNGLNSISNFNLKLNLVFSKSSRGSPLAPTGQSVPGVDMSHPILYHPSSPPHGIIEAPRYPTHTKE